MRDLRFPQQFFSEFRLFGLQCCVAVFMFSGLQCCVAVFMFSDVSKERNAFCLRGLKSLPTPEDKRTRFFLNYKLIVAEVAKVARISLSSAQGSGPVRIRCQKIQLPSYHIIQGAI